MRRTVLRFERLEDRAVPASWGTPWADPGHLTLSFAPDGTDISGTPNNLTALLAAPGSTARTVLLQAFQTWAATANVNIGLVSDSGDAWTSAGQVQGDPRFGDIRIGGRTLAPDVGALTAAFNYFNTESGNVMFNTAATFNQSGAAGTYDLFTVALHEAGHTLGLGDILDHSSIEYEYYQGAHGLGSVDISAIQALYGARQPDAFEGTTGNDTLATATTYAGPLTADLTTVGDVDTYSFTAPTDGSPTMVNLNAAGLSLVVAQVQVLDANGQVVSQGAAKDPTNNDVTLNVGNLTPGQTYYVRVSGSGGVFGVGAYRLAINGAADSTGSGPQQVTGGHATFDSAAALTPSGVALNARLDYTAQVTPDAGSAGTVFRLHAPTAAAGQVEHLIVSVANPGGAQVSQVQVFDANHNSVTTRVLAASGGGTVVEADGVTPDSDYFVQVTAVTGYSLAADFTDKAVKFDLGAKGTAIAGTIQGATLNVAQSQVMFFVLGADGDVGTSVVMSVKDSSGHVVCVLTVQGGTQRSTSLMLAAGRYRIEITSTALLGIAAPTYQLGATGLTDPIGALACDPTNAPQGGSGTGSIPPTQNGQTVYWTTTIPGDGSMWF
ncbi:MAG: matrixin family metalloprotease [Gemmataceae bacterium]